MLLLGEGVQASTRVVPQSPEPFSHRLEVDFFFWFVAGAYLAPVLPLPVPCLKHTFLVIPALAPTSAEPAQCTGGPVHLIILIY